MVVDELARRAGGAFRRGWLAAAETSRVTTDEGTELLLVKPQTYMNRSGAVVPSLLRRKGLGPADVVVVLDDADLPLGRLRLRPQGGAGGHKGLQSVLEALGTDEVARVRVGIGRQAAAGDLVDHVLDGFSGAEQPVMAQAVRRAADAVARLAAAGMAAAMNDFNQAITANTGGSIE